MRNILLAAKFEAIQSGKDKILTTHVKKALKGIEITNGEAKQKIYEVFLIPDSIKLKAQYTQEDLDTAAKHERIKYDSRLKTKLDALKKEGISVSSDKVSKLFKEHSEELLFEIEVDDEDEIAFDGESESEAVSGFERLNSIKDLKQTLLSKLYNQEHAIEAVCDALVKAEHYPTENRPTGIFFFLGPPATGKTYLAELLKESLEGYDDAMVYDMTQFTYEGSGGALYGTSRNFGNTTPGSLTSFVRDNPKSIIVFDEFEKANSKVQANLLSILSGGYLTDACGWCKRNGKPYSEENKCDEGSIEERVDFTDTIVIFTSNLGKEIYNNQQLMEQFSGDSAAIEKMVFNVISRETKKEQGDDVPAISPEFLSRLRQGSVVLFNRLRFEHLLKIAENSFEVEKQAFAQTYGVTVENDSDVLKALLLSFGPEFDVREVKSKIGKMVFDAVTDYYMHHSVEINKIAVNISDAVRAMLAEITSEPKVLQYLKRMSKRLALGIETVYGNGTLELMLDNAQLQQVTKAKDFGGEGIAIELPDVSFSDIAGHHKVKERLQMVVRLLKNYKILRDRGTELSKGMIMFGPPGTGKTLLAKAFANEAQLPFIPTTGQELLQEGKIRQVFSTARENAPSIIFIDEIDSIRARGSSAHNNSYYDGFVNDLLAEIDGFNTSLSDPVFIIAATNRLDGIDEAILRSGRIDIHMPVGYLDPDARAYFIDKMLARPDFDDAIDREQLIKLSAGLSGADLAKVGKESVYCIINKEMEKVTQEIVLEQINIIKYGHKIENRDLSKALEITAYHEAGHAVLSKLLLPYKGIEQVTVMPRAKTLGFVSYSNEDEYYSYSIEHFKNEMRVGLAGRVVQQKKFGEIGIDAGASADLEHATHMAYVAIAKLGMDEAMRNVNFSIFDAEKPYVSPEIEERIKAWMANETEATKALVDEHWSAIERVAERLLDDERIDEETLDTLIKNS